MNKEKYEKCIGYLRQHALLGQMVTFGARLLPMIIALAYVVLLGICLIRDRSVLMRIILVPAITFIVISVFRYIVNRKRPYTVLAFEPLLPYKPDKGKSFPSRHTVCAVIIACTYWYLSPMWGMIFMLLALFVAASRVVSGMHYVSDVCAGIISALVFGCVGYFII